MPASFSLGNDGLLTYTAGNGFANNVTVSRPGGNYFIQDTSENVQFTAAAMAVKQIVVNLSDNNDQILIRSTAVPLTVNAGDGFDNVEVGSTSRSMTDISAPLSINGQNGDDSLTLIDDGTGVGRNYTIQSNRVSRDSMADITYSSMQYLMLFTSQFADTIDAPSHLANCNVYIFGNGGNDAITVGGNSTQVYGGSGNDTIVGSPYDDRVYGEDGDDKIYGNDGNDELYGDNGKDELYGGRGEDFLSGGNDRDILLGRDLAFERANEANYEYDRFQDVFGPGAYDFDGISFMEVDQSRGPTCSILSHLAAVANSPDREQLYDRIQYLGSNMYRVRLFSGEKTTYVDVHFDGTWTSNDAAPVRYRDAEGRPTGAIKGEFWPLLFQRAFLTWHQVNWEEPDPTKWQTPDGQPNQWPAGGWAFRAFSGLNVTSIAPSATSPKQLADFLAQEDMLSAAAGGHRFAILAVYLEGKTWKVQVYNPRAWDEIRGERIDDGSDDGVMTIDWATFLTRFAGADSGVATINRAIKSSPL